MRNEDSASKLDVESNLEWEDSKITEAIAKCEVVRRVRREERTGDLSQRHGRGWKRDAEVLESILVENARERASAPRLHRDGESWGAVIHRKKRDGHRC